MEIWAHGKSLPVKLTIPGFWRKLMMIRLLSGTKSSCLRNTAPIWAAPCGYPQGSEKLSNLKELRAKTDIHVFRAAYIFDPGRKGLLLTGGDKKGRNQRKFYKDLIREAEQVYAAYLEKTAKEKEE
jgi:hypothetical protein